MNTKDQKEYEYQNLYIRKMCEYYLKFSKKTPKMPIM